MAIEKISTKTNFKEWMNTINELIDSDAGKLDSSDNAASASKLHTARTINGTSFDGTKNITTANWGTARNITISDDSGTNTGDAVSVNGSANVTLKLPATIKATLSGNASTATTATKANQLTTARTIDGVSFNGTGNITHFGTCSTAAGTAAKVVSCSGFMLTTGARIIVQFTVTNSAASPTLNVNSTGAKAIVYRNAAISASYLAANRVYEFVYDGTNYELIGDLDSNSDTKVTQTVTTTNAEYPLLTMADAAATSTKTNSTRFASAVTLNPSTKKITCGGISGTNPTSSTWVASAKTNGSLIDYPDNAAGAYAPFMRYKTTNGAFVVGGYKTDFGIYYLTDETIEAGENTVAETFKITESGLVSSTGGFSGNLSGNATTATTATKANQLTTARTIAIGGAVTGTATSFNGTANITIDTTRVNLEDAGIYGELPIAHGGTGRTDGKAVGLVTKRTIDGISFDGTANISHFGTCSTAAATAAKVVSCSGFTLTTGSRIIVQFTVTNSAASPTLNVNNTGAKAIVYRNAAIPASYLAANHVYEFVYDGTNYELIGDIDGSNDTKVKQTVSTTNSTYPILACATANATATTTTTAIFCKNIKINPSAGSITATAVYNAVWNDYAEFFPRGEKTEPGDIIALDVDSQEEKYVKATKDSILIVGSHSNTFGHLIGGENPPDGQDFVEYNLPKFIPVGLAGRVNVKFKGKSKKGYPVTISDVPGVAELCDFNESKVIGYVVEDTNPNSEEIRLVKILIKN